VMAPVEKTGLYHPRGLSARTSSGERGGEGAAIHRKGSNDTRESWGVEMQGYDRLGCGLPDEDDETESKEISHGETSSMGVTFNLCNAILGEDPCHGVAQAPFSATAVQRRSWWQPLKETPVRIVGLRKRVSKLGFPGASTLTWAAGGVRRLHRLGRAGIPILLQAVWNGAYDRHHTRVRKPLPKPLSATLKP
jgi:hypothetical protein